MRVPNSMEKFDNTNIHPSQYNLAKFIIDKKIEVNDFDKYESELKALYDLVTSQTIKDILDSYKNIGVDPRTDSGHLKVEKTKDVKDLKVGDVVKGVVRNVMQFGAFVDIGVKNNGLVHISHLANKFVKDPLDIVHVGEEVQVKIIELDIDKSKIGLSIKDVWIKIVYSNYWYFFLLKTLLA